jgi:hypothetical protein
MSKRGLIVGAFSAAFLGAGIWGLCALWSHFGPSRVPANWSFATTHPKIYRTGYAQVANSQNPRSVVIRSLKPLQYGAAALGQKCDATPFRGQRVRLTGWIQTDGFPDNSAAQILFFVKDPAGGELARGGVGVEESKYWREYAAVVDVPEEASTLFYGMVLSGAGTAWFNDLQIRAVPNTVPLSNQRKPRDLSAMPRLKLGPLLAADLKSLGSSIIGDVSLEEPGAEGRVLKSDLMDGKFFRVSSTTVTEDYAGKKLRLRARIKTADLQGGEVTIYFNSQSQNQNSNDFFATWSKPISGTTDWKDYDCVIAISGQKAMVTAGVSARGKGGSVFLKSLEVSLADDSPPGGVGFEIMQMTLPEPPVLANPMNLDFSK